MAQTFMPTIQTRSFVDMLTSSGQFQPSTASFLPSQQLQIKGNIHPTEVTLYNIYPKHRKNVSRPSSFPTCPGRRNFGNKWNRSLQKHRSSNQNRTWMSAWTEWCKAKNINVNMEWRCCPQALDGLLKKFYVEIRKKDGTDYEPDSLRVIQEAIDRYRGHKKYPVSMNNWLWVHKVARNVRRKSKATSPSGKRKTPKQSTGIQRNGRRRNFLWRRQMWKP